MTAITTQEFTVAVLGVALITLIYCGYDTNIIIAIISGLLGFLTSNKLNSTEITNAVQEAIPTNEE